MSEIHSIIINRLLAAWVAVSLVVGGAVLFLGLAKIDTQLLEQATRESQKVFGAPLLLVNAAVTGKAELLPLAEQMVRQDFAQVTVYDRRRSKIIDATSPKFPNIREVISARRDNFPLDDNLHHEKFQSENQNLLRVMTPLHDPDSRVIGYFEGVFVIDPQTVQRLRQEAATTLAVILGAILLTTLTLYPVILALNRDVMRFSRDLLKGNIQLMEVLGSAIAKRDSDTNIHNYRVTIYAVKLAEAAKIERGSMRDLIVGAFLHDVGKIGISDNILLKPGRLNDDEFKVMKTHVTLGLDILNKAEWLQKARDVVEGHHEKFDGQGYPRGLSGEGIPVAARIFAIVDIFDALTSKRPYKAPLSFDESMGIINGYAGNHLDPRLVGIFGNIIRPLFNQISALSDHAIEEMLREVTTKYFVVSSVASG